MAVGLMSLLKAATADATGSDTEAIVKQSKELAEGLGLPTDRVEKDVAVGSNSERMDQAVELVEETIAAEKRRKNVVWKQAQHFQLKPKPSGLLLLRQCRHLKLQ